MFVDSLIEVLIQIQQEEILLQFLTHGSPIGYYFLIILVVEANGQFSTVSICPVQSEEMATVVDMRNPLTTYCHSLQVFKREMRAYFSSHKNSFGCFLQPPGSHPGGLVGITVSCLHDVLFRSVVGMIVVANAIICTKPSQT